MIALGKGRKRHRGLSDEAMLKAMVDKHLRTTGSSVALRIMDNWEAERKKFVKVFPHEYKRALTEQYAAEMNKGAKAAPQALEVK